MNSFRDQPRYIKKAFFKPLYPLKYLTNWAETLHLSTNGKVIDENKQCVDGVSCDQSRGVKRGFFY